LHLWQHVFAFDFWLSAQAALCHHPSESSRAAQIIAVEEEQEDERSKQKEFEPRMTRIGADETRGLVFFPIRAHPRHPRSKCFSVAGAASAGFT
jgi:hypothetical protein